MDKFERINHKGTVERAQDSIDRGLRAEWERFHENQLKPWGHCFSCHAEDLTHQMILSALQEELDDSLARLFNVRLSEALMFERTENTEIAVTYVKAWYYQQPED